MATLRTRAPFTLLFTPNHVNMLPLQASHNEDDD